MQLFRIVLVAAALLAVAGQYLQEMRRLSVIKRLEGRAARDYYERTRQRSEKVMTAVTIGLVVLAAGVVTYTLVARS